MTVLMSIIPAPMKKPYGHMMTSTMQGLPKVPTTSYPMTTALRLMVATNQQRSMMIVLEIATQILMTQFQTITITMDHMTPSKAWIVTTLMSRFRMI